VFDDDHPDGGVEAAVTSGDAGGSGPAGGGTASSTGLTDRVRSWLTAPLGARLLGAVLAIAGVALLVIGLITLRGKPGDAGGPRPGAVPTTATTSSPATGSTGPSPTATPASTPRRTTTPAPTSQPPARPSHTPTRPAPAPRAPLTVLNNTVQPGLAESAAARFSATGWQVALVGNFAGRIPSTTVYYTPGDAAQQRAAQALAAQFPGIHRVLPRYSGLPPTPAGLVVVLTRDWTG
jgi:hypothetical protein